MDGVRSFLESCSIDLPHGDDDDGTERETVCGLGHRKNRYFHAWLAKNQVRSYPGMLNLIVDWGAFGVVIGVARGDYGNELQAAGADVSCMT